LQAAKVAHIESVARRPDCTDAWTPQGLIQRPQSVGFVGRPQNDQTRQINAPGCSSGRIERAYDDQGSPFAAGFASGR